MDDDLEIMEADNAAETVSSEGDSKHDQALVKTIVAEIKADKTHHAKAFKRMRRDQRVAMWGADEKWPEGSYKANIVGRHIKQKAAALYARNPRCVARRKESFDFAIWDEDPNSLIAAQQTLAAYQQQLAQMPPVMGPPGIDPNTGMVMPAQPIVPELPPEVVSARDLLADYQQGMKRRTELKRVGKTLELLFNHFLRELKPLDFKRAMKRMVRRTCTNCVGYVKLGFHRVMGPRAVTEEKLFDARARTEHLQNLLETVSGEEREATDAEIAELEHSVQSMMQEPEVILQEGLSMDFPASTSVIPDRNCKSLIGFIGAGHLTIEYTYTVDEVKEIFGADVSKAHTAYTTSNGSQRSFSANDIYDEDYEWSEPSEKKQNGLVRVWEYFDKTSGLVYYLADGHPEFLREPAAPDVFVDDFWPVYALTFNDMESEEELFPPSDAALLIDMQTEYNRSRQGLREHRQAARPRWIAPKGVLDNDKDIDIIANLNPFQIALLNVDPNVAIEHVLKEVPVKGVDPNLYETGPLFSDTQLVVGTQEALLGGVAKATATETAVAANATASSDNANSDDLDGCLTAISRAAGQILLREMSEEQVKLIAGPGAFWPQMTLSEIANELHLEVEAGSTGKPNQGIEIQNWKQLLPMLLQMPGIPPIWLIKETLRRLDDKMDMTEAFDASIPSIMSMNSGQQQAGAPENTPQNQGAQGRNNAPTPPGGEGGTDAAYGSNQVE